MRYLLSLSCLALLLVVSAAASWSQPVMRSGEGEEPRVLRRGSGSVGGPPGVRVDDLVPYFNPGPVQRAIGEVNAGRHAQALDPLHRAVEQLDGEDRRRVRFVLAYALHSLNRHDEALPHLQACVAESSTVADYCAWWAANASFALESYGDARAWAQTVRRESIFGPRAWFLSARAMSRLGQDEETLAVLEAFLVDHPQAFYRDDVEQLLAETYQRLGRHDDAAQLFLHLAHGRPGTAVETAANRALRTLRPLVSADVRTRIDHPSVRDTLRRATALFDRHRSEEVIRMLTPVAARVPQGSPEGCETAWLIGRSHTKLRQHSESTSWYDRIIAACTDPQARVRAMYNGGRGYWNAGQRDQAVALFRQLWEEFPNHSFADDAMHFAARIRRSQDRVEEAEQLLLEQIRRWPDGDMLKDATWLLMARPYLAGDYPAALRLADQMAGRTGEDDLFSRGRIAYFRARSLEEMGRWPEARAGFQGVVRDHPMGWFALLASQRLAQREPEGWQRFRQSLDDRAEEAPAFLAVHPTVARDPSFRLGQKLLRLGLTELAQSEMQHLQRRFPNDDDLGWFIAQLYDRMGLYHVSHQTVGRRNALVLGIPNATNRRRWETSHPRAYEDLVRRWARERNIDPFFVLAIMRVESGFQPRVESWANARGLLQLMEGTAQDMARRTGRGRVTAQELFDPSTNVELGTMLMRVLSDRYGGHMALVAGGYNGGSGAVDRWLRERGDLPLDVWVEEIPFGQTRNYVKKVSVDWWIYHWLYGDPGTSLRLPFDLRPHLP